jgi:hypothetical protein
VRASFMAHLRSGLADPGGEQALSSALLHPAGFVETEPLGSVDRPVGRNADHRGATRVAVHLFLT